MKSNCHKLLFTMTYAKRFCEFFSNRMISVTHFAFENIAISKVHAAQDGGDQDGEGQGQVRSMMLCFNVFSQRLFN